jgi:FKBP-type peptidyl-prolyl cis-trans isomerase 2
MISLVVYTSDENAPASEVTSWTTKLLAAESAATIASGAGLAIGSVDSALDESTPGETVSVDLASTPAETFFGEPAPAAAATASSLS